MLSVTEAAERLDVDPSLVRSWIRDGRLPATRIGRNWALSELELEAFARRRSSARGRRLQSASAWAMLALLSGYEAPWVSAWTRSRLESRLDDAEDVIEALQRSEPRATVSRWSVLKSDVSRLATRRNLVHTGLAVPSATELLPSRVDFDAYLRGRDLERIEQELRPRAPRNEGDANLILRVPSHPWILSFETAPDPVVAADLLDHRSGRVQLAARKRLVEAVRDRHS